MNNKSYFPIQTIFRNFPPSQAIEAKIQHHAAKLGQYFAKILNCQVILETHHHSNKGNIYHVRICLAVPNAELVVSRDPAGNHAHEDAYVAIRDAFIAMRRKLQAYTRKLRGKVKLHIPQLRGHIQEIAPMADYGYIETLDGRTYRFSSQSVIDYDFNKLEIGDEVKFVGIENFNGAAASTVYIR